MEHITLILIWVLTWIYSHPHKRVFWPKSGCDLSLLSARDASRSPGSSCLLAYSHVDKMIHGLVVLPQLPPAFPSFTKDRQVVTSSRSSLLRLVCVLSPFQCIGPSALSLTGYLNTIYFLPPLSNCQLIYETKLIICQMSFDSEEGMYKRCSRIRNRRAPELPVLEAPGLGLKCIPRLARGREDLPQAEQEKKPGLARHKLLNIIIFQYL